MSTACNNQKLKIASQTRGSQQQRQQEQQHCRHHHQPQALDDTKVMTGRQLQI
jgi:hypothetical protein